MMKRRKTLKTLSFATASGLILPSFLFTACQSNTFQAIFFTQETLHLINDIAETILPTTADSKGAGSINVANFIDIYAKECFSLEEQNKLKTGLIVFEENCQQKHGQSFITLAPLEKHNYLVEMDDSAMNSTNPHYFSTLKELVIFSYFTSKEGTESALRYVPIPGKYDGDYPFEKGDKAWALA